MNDTVAVPSGALEPLQVFAGFVRFHGQHIPIDFEASSWASRESTDAAFLKALSQVEGVELDYLCVGTLEGAQEEFPEDVWDLTLAQVLSECRWTLHAFAWQLVKHLRRRARGLRHAVVRVKDVLSVKAPDHDRLDL